MKIIILGSKGNLGSELLKVFDGYEVIGWDKEEIDITDKDSLIEKLSAENPDVIINAVAYNAVDKCEEEDGFRLAKKLNADAVGYLADYCLKANILLVQYISDYVFSGEEKTGYSEEDATDPVSKYGISKEMGEKEIFKRAEEGLKYYIIRTSKLFGPRGASEASKESFFDMMIRMSGEKDEIRVINDSEISCFTYTPDLAVETKNLIEEKKLYGIYHVVNSGTASWYDGARYLFDLKGIETSLVPIASDEYPRPAKRPKYSILLNTKLTPLRSWQEALKEYISI
jgi:dTDP-4-dehydrorhamnose reductase